MSQLHDASRLVGRTVLLVENGTSTPAHVMAAGGRGILLRVGDRQRFLERDELHALDVDADEVRVAAAAGR